MDFSVKTIRGLEVPILCLLFRGLKESGTQKNYPGQLLSQARTPAPGVRPREGGLQSLPGDSAVGLGPTPAGHAAGGPCCLWPRSLIACHGWRARPCSGVCRNSGCEGVGCWVAALSPVEAEGKQMLLHSDSSPHPRPRGPVPSSAGSAHPLPGWSATLTPKLVRVPGSSLSRACPAGARRKPESYFQEEVESFG